VLTHALIYFLSTFPYRAISTLSFALSGAHSVIPDVECAAAAPAAKRRKDGHDGDDADNDNDDAGVDDDEEEEEKTEARGKGGDINGGGDDAVSALWRAPAHLLPPPSRLFRPLMDLLVRRG
jgi:hypothetical protein